MNYLAINTQSNLILQPVTAPTQPTGNSITRFIRVGDSTLSKFHKLLSKAKRKGTLVDVGELAKASPYFAETLAKTR